jgi:protein SCO1
MTENKWVYFFMVMAVFVNMAMAACIASAHEAHESEPSTINAGSLKDQKPDLFKLKTDLTPEEVGITEKLGNYLPLALGFLDESGNPMSLDSFINRPTLILPVFYRCPQSCGILLSSLAGALNDVSFEPGKEYKVLAVSFDSQETPADAAEAKKNYLKGLRSDFPQAHWRFLTGNRQNIEVLTQALGFNYKKLDERNFVHPNVLICVAPDGKIIRYLYGTYFLPFDISMAIAEAAKGTPGVSIKKLVSYCFAYDPVGKRYVFETFKISGISILLFLAAFLYFLLRRKEKPASRPDPKKPGFK